MELGRGHETDAISPKEVERVLERAARLVAGHPGKGEKRTADVDLSTTVAPAG